MFLWPTGQALCLSGGTTGDVVTSAVDDCTVDSRFRGNDEMRGGLWVSAGGHRDPPLRLRSGTGHCASIDDFGQLCINQPFIVKSYPPATVHALDFATAILRRLERGAYGG